FGPTEDFAKYPRTLENDLKLIEETLKEYPGKEVIVYAPKNPQEVFPRGEKEPVISVRGVTEMLEGKSRPGHFDGVTTVVHRLFELTKPEKAYFGLKDYQQWVVVKKMVQEQNLPIEIVGMPIARDA